MAEDTMTEAVVISPVVADVLRNAGLLKGDAPPPPPPPPPPPLSVGDQVIIFPLVAVAKNFETQPKDVTRFTLTEARHVVVRGEERGGDYDLDFPPNDERYIPELERLVTAALKGGTIHARANVEITAVLFSGAWYRAELRGLWVYGAAGDRTARATLTACPFTASEWRRGSLSFVPTK